MGFYAICSTQYFDQKKFITSMCRQNLNNTPPELFIFILGVTL
jgi:hypothetical protein